MYKSVSYDEEEVHHDIFDQNIIFMNFDTKMGDLRTIQLILDFRTKRVIFDRNTPFLTFST